jgi:hypothetical protein
MTSLQSGAWNTLRTKAKAQWKANDLPCGICGQPIDWSASGRTSYGASVDHINPRHQTGQTLVPIEELRVVHNKCNAARGNRTRSKGAKTQTGTKVSKSGEKGLQKRTSPAKAISSDRQATPAPSKEAFTPIESNLEPTHGIAPTKDTVLAASWLSDWLSSGGTTVWPRLMSDVHPRAVGSYGIEAIDWIHKRRELDKQIPKNQKQLRLWQQLLLLRGLEHDANGRLVWQNVLVTTRRQVGKSVALRELCLWRVHQAELFGEEQLIMHTAKDLSVAKEVQRPARIWSEDHHYIVRKTHGQEEIELPDGSRWMIRGTRSVYGYSVSMALVDEAWGVDPLIVDDGLEPTMIERESPQLWLISTAHRQASSLMLKRRKQALRDLLDPKDTLIMEWSALRNAKHSDELAWQSASPHWDERAEAFISSKVGTDGFAEQWLNIWPTGEVDTSNHFVDEDLWRSKAFPMAKPSPDTQVVIAVEDNFGTGASAAMAWVEGETKYVTGKQFDRLADAWKFASEATENRLQSTVLCGITLRNDPAVQAQTVPVVPVGMKETRSALPLVRELLATGKLRHADSQDLNDQVLGTVVKPAPAGGLSLSTNAHARSDLLRCMAWAVQHVHKQIDDTPIIF